MFYILRILVTFYDNIPSFQKKRNVFKNDPYFVYPKLILHNRSHATGQAFLFLISSPLSPAILLHN